MAALGFSVLMREWRRGMAFDPWHGSLYLKLSAVITLFPSFSLSLEKQTCTTGFDQVKSGTLNPFQDRDPDSTSSFCYQTHHSSLSFHDNLESIVVD